MRQRSRTRRKPVDVLDRPPSRKAVQPLLSALGPVIYAIRVPGGLVKIGFTTDLGNRYHTLHASIGDILGWMPATFEQEQRLHKSLEGLAVHGREWYEPRPEVLDVVNAMREELGLLPVTDEDIEQAA